MIPQLQERVAKLEAMTGPIEQALGDLRANLSELREQIQVERLPQPAPPVTTAMEAGASCKPYRYRPRPK